MKRATIATIVVLAAMAGAFLGVRNPAIETANAVAPAATQTPVGATLLPGLGNYEFAITTRDPQAQRWFNQALMLTFGFNHDAAERSFLKAAELDPDCAMCWWGAALVLGPHVNAAMDPADNDKAWQSVQRAVALAPRATPREQAFIRALTARYAAKPPEDRKPLDEAYAKAAAQLVAERPDDLDARVLYAEAMMDLQPWDYYDEQLRPKGHTAEVISQLEHVIARNPEHAGALHLYVHAVEASAEPQRGVVAADRLRTLIPGSGHLVHMPAHIYARVGRWHDAVIANQIAIAADNAYLAMCGRTAKGVYPLGYVPHNPHFLWFAASMEGASKIAEDAARQTAQRVNLPELMRQPGFAGLQHYWMTPWFDDVRFGRWDEIRKAPNPAADLPYVTAIWSYAQALAAVRQDRIEDARRHYEQLAKLAADPAMAQLMMWDRYPLSHAVQIAERSVNAELALARHDNEAAIRALTTAVTIEDKIPYDEPPGWHAPTRQALGAVLLQAGHAKEAEQVYREELRRNPANGWSLKGLQLALSAQKRNDEAAAVARQLQDAWQHADVQLVASRF
jgi:tetratricopeptide (TPR) repeat protein